MNNKNIAEEWFAFANSDLKSAIFLLRMKPTPLEIISYHCQQCAEKYLKGFIAFHGGKIKRTHDLVVLNRECQKFDISFQNIIEECINLTDYGVQVRYPFHIDIEEHDVKNAIKESKKIRKFIINKISQLQNPSSPEISDNK
ncbi:MAG: HEPN domain-containing protein [Bacillota bacterium]